MFNFMDCCLINFEEENDLHIACKDLDIKYVDFYLEHNSKFFLEFDSAGNTALHIASQQAVNQDNNRQCEIIIKLIGCCPLDHKLGFVNTVNKSGYSALDYILLNNNLSAVESLFGSLAGSDLKINFTKNTRNIISQTCLDTKIVSILLEHYKYPILNRLEDLHVNNINNLLLKEAYFHPHKFLSFNQELNDDFINIELQDYKKIKY